MTVRVVVDAQLIAGYFREAICRELPPYSASTVDLIARLGKTDQAYVDNDGLIEQEYRELVDPEWFDAWYGDRLQAGDFVSIPRASCAEFIKTLADKFGFPAHSKDRHYVALAVAVVARHEQVAVLVSEDLDFYEPKAKAGSSKQRDRIIGKQTGPVLRFLSKKKSILVRSVAAHLATPRV